MNKMNPELRRYGWRNFSLPLLLLPPVVMGLYIALWHLPPVPSRTGGIPELAIAVVSGALAIIAAFLIIHRAASALSEEFAEKTWDFQCMSSRPPFEILLGKLLGSASYGWYCLACVMAGYFVLVGIYEDASHFGKMVQLVLAVFLGSIAAFTSGVFMARAGEEQRLGNSLSFVTGVGYGVFSFVCMKAVRDFFDSGLNPMFSGFFRSYGEANWYGLELSMVALAPLVLLAYTLWLLASAWQSLRAQLRYPVGNNLVFAFLLFHCLFVLGFATGPDRLFLVLLSLSLTCLILAVAALLVENAGSEKYRRLFLAFQKKIAQPVRHLLPKWTIFFMAAVVLLFGAALVTLKGNFALRGSEEGLCFMAALFLFFARDIILYHLFVMDRAGRKSLIAFFVALTVYYGMLMPYLPFSLNPFKDPQLLSILSAGVQMLVVALIAWPSLRRRLVPPPIEPKAS
jgi:hypothetical protein